MEVLKAESLEAALTVSKLEHSVTWYCEAIGFAIDQRHEREGRLIAVSLRAGAIRILLAQDDGSKGSERAKGVGFSLQITTSQKVEDIASRIKTYGSTLDTEPTKMPWGVTAFRLRDPDGFRWTISSTQTV